MAIDGTKTKNIATATAFTDLLGHEEVTPGVYRLRRFLTASVATIMAAAMVIAPMTLNIGGTDGYASIAEAITDKAGSVLGLGMQIDMDIEPGFYTTTGTDNIADVPALMGENLSIIGPPPIELTIDSVVSVTGTTGAQYVTYHVSGTLTNVYAGFFANNRHLTGLNDWMVWAFASPTALLVEGLGLGSAYIVGNTVTCAEAPDGKIANGDAVLLGGQLLFVNVVSASPGKTFTVTTSAAPDIPITNAQSYWFKLKKLPGTITNRKSTGTITIATPGVINWTAHGLSADMIVAFSTTGNLPTGLTVGRFYYVKTVSDADHFTVANTLGGTAITTSGSQSGTHTIIDATSVLGSSTTFATHGETGAVLVTNGWSSIISTQTSDTVMRLNKPCIFGATDGYCIIPAIHMHAGPHEVTAVNSGASTITVLNRSPIPVTFAPVPTKGLAGGDMVIPRVVLRQSGTGDGIVLNGPIKKIENVTIVGPDGGATGTAIGINCAGADLDQSGHVVLGDGVIISGWGYGIYSEGGDRNFAKYAAISWCNIGVYGAGRCVMDIDEAMVVGCYTYGAYTSSGLIEFGGAVFAATHGIALYVATGGMAITDLAIFMHNGTSTSSYCVFVEDNSGVHMCPAFIFGGAGQHAYMSKGFDGRSSGVTSFCAGQTAILATEASLEGASMNIMGPMLNGILASNMNGNMDSIAVVGAGGHAVSITGGSLSMQSLYAVNAAECGLIVLNGGNVTATLSYISGSKDTDYKAYYFGSFIDATGYLYGSSTFSPAVNKIGNEGAFIRTTQQNIGLPFFGMSATYGVEEVSGDIRSKIDVVTASGSATAGVTARAQIWDRNGAGTVGLGTGLSAGFWFIIFNRHVSAITIQANGTDTINGGSAGGSMSLNANQWALMEVNGSGGWKAMVGGGATLATVAEIRAGTDTTKMASVGDRASAEQNVALTPGATVTPDNSLGINFTLTLGQNTAIANMTNVVLGRRGFISIQQDTSTRTVTWGTDYEWPGGTAPTISAGSGATDVVEYWHRSAGRTIMRVVGQNYS